MGHGPSLHVHKGIATEGKGLQVAGQKISEETEATRFLLIFCALLDVERSCSSV